MADHQIQLQPGDTLDVSVAECPPVIVEPEPDPEPVEPPGLAGRPTFLAIEGGVRVEWAPAERATSYRITRRDAETFDVSQPFALLPLVDGDWVCVEPRNEAGAAPDKSCNTYEGAAEPAPPDEEPEEPAQPGEHDLTLHHDFVPAKGVTLPEGVAIRESPNSTLESDHYRIRFPVNWLDGRGPGRIGMEVLPWGLKALMTEYDMEINANWEDHPNYTKNAHWRFKNHPDGKGAAKFYNGFFGERLSFKTESYVSDLWETDVIEGGQKTGVKVNFDTSKDAVGYRYRGIHANLGDEIRLTGGRYVIRTLIEYLRADAKKAGVHWWRIRWWINGTPQGDQRLPMYGTDEIQFWEIAPTWGGNGGWRKKREDVMKIFNVKTWV